MNPDFKISNGYEYLNREERRKKGKRSGFKIYAKLSRKQSKK